MDWLIFRKELIFEFFMIGKEVWFKIVVFSYNGVIEIKFIYLFKIIKKNR